METIGIIALIIWLSLACVALYVMGYKSGEADEYARGLDERLHKLQCLENIMQYYRDKIESLRLGQSVDLDEPFKEKKEE